ncbi:hypothetical protein QMT37_003428 [Vibrio fluvialis]|nr:hypothetical protein [Vibrio fluvialis]ELW1731595.1 hypothetical protein [Vibrio fluvialis]
MRIQENLNTIIGSAGLLLASLTAYHQFGLTSDRLDIEAKLVPGYSSVFERKFSHTDIETNIKTDISGPAYWKVIIYNPSDRPVTIKNYDTYLISENGYEIKYKNLIEGIFDQRNTLIDLPISVEPRRAKILFLGLNIKVIPDISNCYSKNSSLHEVELCSYKQGSDIFGNKVEYKEFLSPLDTYGYNVFFSQDVKSPVYIFSFETGDNSLFQTQLIYY